MKMDIRSNSATNSQCDLENPWILYSSPSLNEIKNGRGRGKAFLQAFSCLSLRLETSLILCPWTQLAFSPHLPLQGQEHIQVGPPIGTIANPFHVRIRNIEVRRPGEVIQWTTLELSAQHPFARNYSLPQAKSLQSDYYILVWSHL